MFLRPWMRCLDGLPGLPLPQPPGPPSGQALLSSTFVGPEEESAGCAGGLEGAMARVEEGVVTVVASGVLLRLRTGGLLAVETTQVGEFSGVVEVVPLVAVAPVLPGR